VGSHERYQRRAVFGGLSAWRASAVGLSLLGGSTLLSLLDLTNRRSGRIGYLTGGVAGHPQSRQTCMHLSRALAAYGWVEGQSFVLEFRSSDGEAERLHALAASLVLSRSI